ncbi:MAG: response regulator [Anaerolineae bacterium]
MYDNAALAAAPATLALVGAAEGAPQSRATAVRSLLLDAIEFLRPPRHESLRSDVARSHSVLWLRYVEGMSILQVGEELALSERQTHRELREAEGKVLEVLLDRLAGPGPDAPADAAGDPEAVKAAPATVDVAATLAAAARVVQPLADRLGVVLEADASSASGKAFLDEGILRQLLTQALSLAVQVAGGAVRATGEGYEASVRLDIAFQAGGDASEDMLAGMARLAAAIGVQFAYLPGCGFTVTVPLRLPRNVLVVEDNEGAVELYRRYLEAGGEWRVVHVADARLTYDLARSLRPSLILLDLLMPGTDGWSILNLLHANEATAGIPVLVCSVFQDPLLAEALGAKAHLRKPVSQGQLLDAVRRWAR